jgi:Asp/Glu/hydantoin racemase
MLMYKIAIIPPIPLTETEIKRRENQYRQYSDPGFEIEIRILKGGPPLTDNEEDLLLASRFIIEEAILSEKEGSDAIVIDCTTDPGMSELEQSLKIPIAGSLKSSIKLALSLGKFYSILALDNSWAGMIGQRIDKYNLGKYMTSIETVGTHVYNPDRKRDMNETEFQSFFEQLLRSGRQALNSGAETIILGSTTVIRGWKELEDLLKIPVIAPGIAALKDAQKMISSTVVL